MSGNSPAPRKSSQSNEVRQLSPFEHFVKAIQTEAELTKNYDNGNEIAADVIGRILEAETMEEAFAKQDAGLLNGKDLVDVELTVNDFEMRPSDAKYTEKSVLGVYMRVMAVRLEDGEEASFFTGAPNVVALLWKARQTGNFPLDCVIKSKETANGELLTLRPLPKRVIR